MPEYHLLTIWHIEAPLENVYGAIFDPLQWPHWWKGSEKVEQKASGDVNGIDSIRRYSWRGRLPYRCAGEPEHRGFATLVGDAKDWVV
ncbi:MAG: hypothetical protein WCB88_02375, partial [Azonexus sp.]